MLRLCVCAVHAPRAEPGDIAPADNVSKAEKQRREERAMQDIRGALERYSPETGAALMAVYGEYEHRGSLEAKAVKDLDLLEMVVQADEYQTWTGIELDEFFAGVSLETHV